MGIEENIKASFRGVKLDILSVKNQILKLAEAQEELRHTVNKVQESSKKKASKKTSKKSSKKKK